METPDLRYVRGAGVADNLGSQAVNQLMGGPSPIEVRMMGSRRTKNETPSVLGTQDADRPHALARSGACAAGQASEGVVMALDDRLRYVFWNEAAERMTGIPAGAALGRTFYASSP